MIRSYSSPQTIAEADFVRMEISSARKLRRERRPSLFLNSETRLKGFMHADSPIPYKVGSD